MKRVDALLSDAEYITRVAAIGRSEKERRFCRHDLTHFLDVARIAWIACLEERLPFDKETVYLAALLHDLGRSESTQDHDHVGSALACNILTRLQAPEDQIAAICTAIASHRDKSVRTAPTLASLLARADKQSRLCFACPVREDCYWPESTKNRTIHS